MSVDSQWEVQQGIYTALTGSAALANFIGTRIFNSNAPQDSVFPYVVLGEVSTADWDTKTEDGMEMQITIHIWSRYRGNKEAMQIMAEVVTALDDVSISVGSFNLLFIRFNSSVGPLLDPDGFTNHSIQRFQVFVQE